MKTLVGGLSLLLFSSLYAHTLDTSHFTVTVTCQTEEYEQGCSSVIYHGVNKKTGEEIQLQGKQVMAACTDGVTPCHSLGYEFTNGDIHYFVSEGGKLKVSKGKKTLVNEAGEWFRQ